MKIHIPQLLSHKCWVACQSSARLNNTHAWNLYKQSVSYRETNIKKSLHQHLLKNINIKASDLLERQHVAVNYLPSIRAKQNAQPFLPVCHRTHSTGHFCPLTSNPPRDLVAFHWWPPLRKATESSEPVRTREEVGKGGGKGEGGDSGGCSVTLEEIRRLSSPLMTVEIVFQ